MKKIVFILLLPFIFKGQDFKYCELVGYAKWFSSKIVVAVDSGGGLNWSTLLKDSADLVKPAEYKNEKFYVQTNEALYEGKQVQSDAKGKFIWKKVEVNAEKTETVVKVKTFNSMIDGMNYMGHNGWEFVQAYVVTSGSQNVYRYVLKKKK
jgi:hypothetical protein